MIAGPSQLAAETLSDDAFFSGAPLLLRAENAESKDKDSTLLSLFAGFVSAPSEEESGSDFTVESPFIGFQAIRLFEESDFGLGMGLDYGYTLGKDEGEELSIIPLFFGLVYADGDAMRSGEDAFYGGIGIGFTWISGQSDTQALVSVPLRFGFRAELGFTAFVEIAPTLGQVGESDADTPMLFQIGIGWSFGIKG